MGTNQKPPIDRDLIKTSGEILKWIGYLIFVNIFISVLFSYLIYEKEERINLFTIGEITEEIKNLYWIWGILSFILIIIKGIFFIESGVKMMNSVSQPNENYGKLNKTPIVEVGKQNSEGIYFETEFFTNGKIKIKKSFNKEGLNHGIWEYYLENGELDYKEFYLDGNWIQNI